MGKQPDITKRHIAFGKKIQKLRKLKNWTQEQLALEMDVDPSYVGFIERAERNITLDNIFKLADALELDPRELF